MYCINTKRGGSSPKEFSNFCGDLASVKDPAYEFSFHRWRMPKFSVQSDPTDIRQPYDISGTFSYCEVCRQNELKNDSSVK
jgi:hypothetical protein